MGIVLAKMVRATGPCQKSAQFCETTNLMKNSSNLELLISSFDQVHSSSYIPTFWWLSDVSIYGLFCITFPQTFTWVWVELVDFSLLHGTSRVPGTSTVSFLVLAWPVLYCLSKSTFSPVPGPHSLSSRTIKTAYTPKESKLPIQNT
jgi:hypothetical protein